MKGVVSKETVVLRQWGSSIQKFGFINRVDNVNWPPYRNSKKAADSHMFFGVVREIKMARELSFHC